MRRNEVSMEYRLVAKGNGDYEVWRKTVFSDKPEEHVATFHNYASPNVARVNAENFCTDQNEREKLLREVIEGLHNI